MNVARIGYALFDGSEQADAAVRALTRHGEDHPAFSVQVHAGRLVAQDLPDCGTEVARNNVMAMVVGGTVGALGGAVAGGWFDIMGLDAGIGAGVGLLSGVLMGLLMAMMSGARSPKRPLRDLAAELERGKVIVTVAIDDHRLVGRVERILRDAGGRRIGTA